MIKYYPNILFVSNYLFVKVNSFYRSFLEEFFYSSFSEIFYLTI